jgi:hypothetical protein
MYIGGRTGGTDMLDGMIYDVQFYSRALCPTEIAQLYGLVGYWKLDETSGTAAADSSGLGRSGTVVGTATWTTGKIGNSLQLDGNTHMEVASLMDSPKNVTLSAWANLTTADSSGAEVISLGDCLAIRLNSGTTSQAFFYNGSTWTAISKNQTFTAGWHHFATVFDDDNDSFTFYVDGAQAATTSTTSSISYSGLGTKTVLGTHGNGQTTMDFTGKIDDARVYNRALCPTEVQQLFSSGGPGGVTITKWVEMQ